MNRQFFKGLWQFARAILFYPAAIAIMIWLLLTGKHWIWGVAVLLAVLILDPIYRIMLRQILSWRPHRD
jgi:hypothetical protein